MLNINLRAVLPRKATSALVILASLLLVAVALACSDGTPTEAPSSSSQPSETAVASPATPEPPPTTVPATAVLPPTGTTEPPTPTLPAVAPVPRDTPLPEPAVAATAEPAPPPVPQYVSEEHEAASEKVYDLVTELVEELGHREAGTPEELQAAEHLRERLDAMGYSAEIQSFTMEFFDVQRYIQTRGENAQIIVESPIQAQSPGLILSTTPGGGLETGTAIAVGEEGPGEDLTGKIALLHQEDLAVNNPVTLQSLLERVNTAAGAGASAAVITGNITGMEQFAPLFGAQVPIPALILPQPQIGAQLYAMAQSSEVTLSVNIETQALESQNVLAELEGTGDGLVIVGGHYDVVPQTEDGANDNTSGIAVVLALAEALANESMPFSVRFIAFGAEEIGLFGSIHYLQSLSDEELAGIRAMLNFDVVATGDLLAATGDEGLTELALKVAEDLGVKSEPQPLPAWASSDHQPFEGAGVPVLLLYGPDVSRIHTPNDVLEFVQPERLGEALLVALGVLQSPDIAE